MKGGFAALPPQHRFLAFLAKAVKIGFLVCIAGAVITGPMQVWAGGRDIMVAGLTLPSPFGANPDLKDIVEELHEFFVHAWIPLLILHVLGALKHAVIDKNGVLMSMIKPKSGGR